MPEGNERLAIPGASVRHPSVSRRGSSKGDGMGQRDQCGGDFKATLTRAARYGLRVTRIVESERRHLEGMAGMLERGRTKGRPSATADGLLHGIGQPAVERAVRFKELVH